MEATRTYTAETVNVVLREGKSIRDLIARCRLRPALDGIGYVNGDAPADMLMTLLCYVEMDDVTVLTLTFTYAPGMYEPAAEWLMSAGYRDIVALACSDES